MNGRRTLGMAQEAHPHIHAHTYIHRERERERERDNRTHAQGILVEVWRLALDHLNGHDAKTPNVNLDGVS
jgi:muconolactone delta-isomerase